MSAFSHLGTRKGCNIAQNRWLIFVNYFMQFLFTIPVKSYILLLPGRNEKFLHGAQQIKRTESSLIKNLMDK